MARGGGALKPHRGTRCPVADPDDTAQRKLAILGTARPEKAVRLIVQALSRFGRLGGTAKELVKETRLPRSTLYPHLRRLEEIGEILRPGRGMYALSSTYHDLTADPTAIVGVQNIKFEVTKWEKQPIPPCGTGQSWDVRDGGSAGWFRTKEDSLGRADESFSSGIRLWRSSS